MRLDVELTIILLAIVLSVAAVLSLSLFSERLQGASSLVLQHSLQQMRNFVQMTL